MPRDTTTIIEVRFNLVNPYNLTNLVMVSLKVGNCARVGPACSNLVSVMTSAAIGLFYVGLVEFMNPTQ